MPQIGIHLYRVLTKLSYFHTERLYSVILKLGKTSHHLAT